MLQNTHLKIKWNNETKKKTGEKGVTGLRID